MFAGTEPACCLIHVQLFVLTKLHQCSCPTLHVHELCLLSARHGGPSLIQLDQKLSADQPNVRGDEELDEVVGILQIAWQHHTAGP